MMEKTKPNLFRCINDPFSYCSNEEIINSYRELVLSKRKELESENPPLKQTEIEVKISRLFIKCEKSPFTCNMKSVGIKDDGRKLDTMFKITITAPTGEAKIKKTTKKNKPQQLGMDI